MDPIDILYAYKSTSEFSTILCKSFKTYPYPNESRGLSPFSNIPDPVGDEENHEEDDATSENHWKKETEKKSRF